MIKNLKLLLSPFSLLYGCVMQVRNMLYDKGILATTKFALPVLSVGNLTVGGTGKTPHVEYLLRLLKQKYKVSTLSRGYKRKSKGFLLADASATATILGDEPFQYYRDFPEVHVAVSEDRVKGVEGLLRLVPETEVIVLDDAMQHRPVVPSFNILLTDFNRPFYKDYVLPAGFLREFRSGADRADAVIVSKCPAELDKDLKSAILYQIRKFIRVGTPVFFSTYTYGVPVAMGSQSMPGRKVLLLTGIANAEPLKEDLVASGYEIIDHFAFADHHAYTRQDLLQLQKAVEMHASVGISILTTRKDAVKLAAEELQELSGQLPVFYIPIEVEFLERGSDFDQLVLQHVQAFAKQKL